MSDTTDVTSGVSDVADDGATTTAVTKRRRAGTGLSAMLLPELQSLAASLGISGTARMRKGELITAISERQNGAAPAAPAASAKAGTSRSRASNGSGTRAAEPPATLPIPEVAEAPVAKARVAKARAAETPVAEAPAVQAPAAPAASGVAARRDSMSPTAASLPPAPHLF